MSNCSASPVCWNLFFEIREYDVVVRQQWLPLADPFIRLEVRILYNPTLKKKEKKKRQTWCETHVENKRMKKITTNSPTASKRHA